MTRCDGCRYAEWFRATKDESHPRRGGRCTYKVEMPELPVAYFWVSRGGYIERGRDHGRECVHWTPVKED